MRMIFLGAPGTGKGTQASYFAQKYALPQISTGDILRKAVQDHTGLGDKAKAIMESGGLVSDDIIIALVQDRLSQPDCEQGYILDGFPRTLEQAQALDKLLGREGAIDAVIYFEVSEEEIIRRLTSRRVCVDCGEVYNTISNPPPDTLKCLRCGGQIIQRDDDSVETVKNRLKVYYEKTYPLKSYYEEQKKLRIIDGIQGVDKVRADIETIYLQLLG